MRFRLRRHDGEYRWLLDNGIPAGPILSYPEAFGSEHAQARQMRAKEVHETGIAQIQLDRLRAHCRARPAVKMAVDRVVDQGPVEARAVGVADDVGEDACGEAAVVLGAGAGRHAHRVLAVELGVRKVDPLRLEDRLWLFARRDTDPSRPVRNGGREVQSATGATLYIEDHGSPHAQPIILTHGWSMDSTIWYYAKRDLAQTHRVLAWDLPGLGKSKRGDATVCLSSFAQDLKTVIAQAGDSRAILVGHSIGGMIIETLARDDPAFFGRHVDKVVLCNTTYTNPLRTMILPRLLQALRKPVIVPMMMLQVWLSPLVWLMQWQSYLSGSQHMAVRFGFGRHVTRSQLDHTALLMTRNSPAVVARGDLAMIRAELTRFITDARSRVGAGGLMQLMPGTAKRFNVGKIHDPEQNIRFQTPGDWELGGGTGVFTQALLDHGIAPADLLLLDTGHLVPVTFVVAKVPGRILVDVPEGLREQARASRPPRG